MGAVLKTIKGLKKSKKFPGPRAHDLAVKKYKGKKTSQGIETIGRIYRTQDRRDTLARVIKGFREDKGKFRAYTGNAPGSLKKIPQHHVKYGKVRQKGPFAIVTKAGTPKKDLRKFKEFIKSGTRRK